MSLTTFEPGRWQDRNVSDGISIKNRAYIARWREAKVTVAHGVFVFPARLG